MPGPGGGKAAQGAKTFLESCSLGYAMRITHLDLEHCALGMTSAQHSSNLLRVYVGWDVTHPQRVVWHNHSPVIIHHFPAAAGRWVTVGLLICCRLCSICLCKHIIVAHCAALLPNVCLGIRLAGCCARKNRQLQDTRIDEVASPADSKCAAIYSLTMLKQILEKP